MNDIIDTWTEEIKDRCKNQNIDIDNCLIMFQRIRAYINGKEISSFSESEDGKWMNILIYNDEIYDMSGEYVYTPQHFEIKDKMTTYLSNGYISTLTTIWLLKSP